MELDQPTNDQFNPFSKQYRHWGKRTTLMFIGAVLVIASIVSIFVFRPSSKPSNPPTSNTYSSASASLASAGAVAITANGFSPASISIQEGQTITWVNEDTHPHQPATDPYPNENDLPGFIAPAPLQEGDSYSFTFNKAGTFTYHDHLNPLQFKGTVIVK